MAKVKRQQQGGKKKSKLRVKREHKNGLSWPLHPLQVVAWVLFPILTAAFFSLCIPAMTTGLQVFLSTVHALLCVCVCVYGAKTTISNPIDRIVEKTIAGEAIDIDTEAYRHLLKYCHVCRAYVRPLSMHCRVCNKCVETFDHHCMWLNNCVGYRNYRIFFKTLSFTTFMILDHLLVCFVLTLLYIFSEEFRDHVLNTYDGGLHQITWLVLQIVMCVLLGAISFEIVKLYKFHIDLIRNNSTTYAYLTDRTSQSRSNERGVIFPEGSSESERATSISVLAAVCTVFISSPRRPIGNEAKLEDAIAAEQRQAAAIQVEVVAENVIEDCDDKNIEVRQGRHIEAEQIIL